MYCRNKEENANKESVFEVQLVKQNKFYEYGFSMILSQRTITGEWVYELLPGGDAQMIFERKAGQPPQLGDKINISAADRTKFQIYADDMVYVIDELERSLHPKLTYHFIDLFKQFHEKKNVQLIFTTHEPTIMDQELFRHDEIWIVERNADNYSHLYSLDKFKE